MARIPDAELSRLKAEVSVQRLVEGCGVALRRQGRDYVGACPFHEDDSPSLVVTPGKNFRLDGVTPLNLIGGLTERMLAHPEEIGWGLGEVARVEVVVSSTDPVLELSWEGERRLSIALVSASVRDPGVTEEDVNA